MEELKCPICGEECDYFFRSIESKEICGCNYCIEKSNGSGE